jgi:hypothetical protein
LVGDLCAEVEERGFSRDLYRRKLLDAAIGLGKDVGSVGSIAGEVRDVIGVRVGKVGEVEGGRVLIVMLLVIRRQLWFVCSRTGNGACARLGPRPRHDGEGGNSMCGGRPDGRSSNKGEEGWAEGVAQRRRGVKSSQVKEERP